MQTIHRSRIKPLFLIYRALAWIFLGLGLQAAPFTYQGQLSLSGKPASGSFDLQVVLYDALTGGNNVGRTNIASALPVNQGAFTVDLDFGSNVFDGNPRWLEISARTNGASDFTLLAPRQAINAVPYAQYALTPAGPQGPAGPKGDKGDPGSFPTTGTIGINVAPFLPNTALQLAPVSGSGGALTIGGNPVGTILEFGLTDPNHGESYIQSAQQQGTWGELQLSPNGGGVAIGKNGGGSLSINGDIQISGIATAQRFVGDGSGLTNLNIPPGLTGPAGPQGPQGLQGQPGPQGPPGIDGAVGPQGPTGPVGINWTGNFDFSVVYKKGDAMFRAGSSWISLIDHSQAGEDPSSPNYTATDWAKLADHGADGLPGPAGPAGPQGPQGVAGPVGPQGVPGTDGAIGPQGPSGPVGPAGPKGDKGDAGVLPVLSKVIAWGENSYGQATPPFDVSNITAIAAGSYHSLALRSDGTVVAWGDNSFGQATVPPSLSGVTAIAAGECHSLALKSDGTVVTWGNTNHDQIAFPTNLSSVIAIAAGGTVTLAVFNPFISHSLALKNDGSVVGWGDNFFGQAAVPSGISGVTAIAAGGFHSLALKNDGTVIGWGDNSAGQTDIPPGLTGVTAIAARDYHSLALKSDGTVVAWGYYDTGAQITVPTGLSGITAIATGHRHSLALKGDGTVITWGTDEEGLATVPSGLTSVTAIAAGTHSLAIQKYNSTAYSLSVPGRIDSDGLSVNGAIQATGGLQIGGPLSGGNGLNITGSVATTGSVQIAGQDAATGDSETLKMIRGVILSNGTVLQGKGYSVTHVSAGDYIITFANPFDAANGGQNYPAVTVTPINAEGCTCTVNYTKAGSFETILNGPAGKRADILFSFIALGVR